MNKTINFESLEAVYTHTSIFTRQWSKGGSREQQKLAILPRDCE